MRFWVGGYTADADGSAEGIGILQAGAADDPLAGGDLAFAGTAAVTSSPSWVTRHPSLDVVYAAQEAAGTVQAFARSGETTLTPLGEAVAVGEAVCHLAVAPGGTFLVASCYGDGRVVSVPLDAAGGLRAAGLTAGVAPTDPYAGGDSEARMPHAHQSRFVPDRPETLVTTDLGFDAVRVWGVEAAGLRLRHEVPLPRGTGPRHTVWHPSGHLYVVTEYSNEVFVLRPARDGVWALVGGAQLVGTRVGADYPAEISLSRDGRFVYAGIRGSNTVATLRVGGDGDQLTTVALAEAGVDWPRHHLVVRDTLLVAGQRSDEVVSLALDERTGVPGRVRRRTAVPTPTCLVALS